MEEKLKVYGLSLRLTILHGEMNGMNGMTQLIINLAHHILQCANASMDADVVDVDSRWREYVVKTYGSVNITLNRCFATGKCMLYKM